MKTWAANYWGWLLLAVIVSFNLINASAATFYVNVSNAAPASPFTTWATAATNIQNAIDVSTAGDLILVTNGIYQAGGRVIYGSLTNRVAVNKAITVQSVNGPSKTLIRGNPNQGNSAVRCVYLTNNAVLIGFTLTNGATRTSGDLVKEQCGGGVWCVSGSALVSNCVITVNSAYGYGGGSYSGTLANCTLSGNVASGITFPSGGGALGGTLNYCMISNNSAVHGGGVGSNTLNNCTLFANSATADGGGSFYATLNSCVLNGNTSSLSGGGSYGGVLNGCVLTAESPVPEW